MIIDSHDYQLLILLYTRDHTENFTGGACASAILAPQFCTFRLYVTYSAIEHSGGCTCLNVRYIMVILIDVLHYYKKSNLKSIFSGFFVKLSWLLFDSSIIKKPVSKRSNQRIFSSIYITCYIEMYKWWNDRKIITLLEIVIEVIIVVSLHFHDDRFVLISSAMKAISLYPANRTKRRPKSNWTLSWNKIKN